MKTGAQDGKAASSTSKAGAAADAAFFRRFVPPYISVF
ncbi:hypothetical protein KNP414_02373 [Paenibacillus mucilaginosus KNP414]|uniref:Uncharacterized protein n=1 Tax=Paenibacillus mucilaginosus (strain KNP414) TaxID=1036673 RepID=F8F5C3_PAEMK|nr:hypothetical protein KNP414_02373 [Paenibacillus mucilaginosus KNP414]